MNDMNDKRDLVLTPAELQTIIARVANGENPGDVAMEYYRGEGHTGGALFYRLMLAVSFASKKRLAQRIITFGEDARNDVVLGLELLTTVIP